MPIYSGYPSLPPAKQGEGQQYGPRALQSVGPQIALEVAVPALFAEALRKQNADIPAPFSGSGLIDTGATYTAIDERVAASLGVPPVGLMQGNTPGGATTLNVYAVSLNFISSGFGAVEPWAVAGCDLAGFGVSALIGRDLLSVCVLVYNGKDGHFTLSV